jgi:hypothetical protein
MSQKISGLYTTMHRHHVPSTPSAARQEGPRFVRFAAAMDEARATGAPQFVLYLDQAIGGEAPRPSPGRTTLRWVGIGGCVLVVCVLLASWLMWPQTAQLFGHWLAMDESRTGAHGETVSTGSPPAAARARATV